MTDRQSKREKFTNEEREQLREFAASLTTWQAEEPPKDDNCSTEDLNHKRWLEAAPTIPYDLFNKLIKVCETPTTPGNFLEYLFDEAEKHSGDVWDISDEEYKKAYDYYNQKETRPLLLDENGNCISLGAGPSVSLDALKSSLSEILEDDAAAEIIVSFWGNTPQTLITHSDYKYALTTLKNDTAYIIDIGKQLRYTFDKNGDPVLDIQSQEDYDAYNALLDRSEIPAEIADTDLLGVLLTAVHSVYEENCGYNYGDRITVNFPNFARALQVQFDKDENPKGHFDIWGKLRQLEDIGGVIVEDKSILRVFAIMEYNIEENTLTFASPYLYRLSGLLKKNPVKVLRPNTPLWEKEGIAFLIDARIITARNKTAVQLIKNIVAGVVSYGNTSEADRHHGKKYTDKEKVEYSISFETLIDRTPLLYQALQAASSSNKANILKRSFIGGNYPQKRTDPATKKSYTVNNIIEEYLHEYTQVYEYWNDFKITIPKPSLKALKDRIIITHKGLNGDFKSRLSTPKIEKKGDNTP